jgi:hypothetical protein
MAKRFYYNENEVLITNPRTSGMKAGSFKGQDLVDILSFLPDEVAAKSPSSPIGAAPGSLKCPISTSAAA